MRRLNVTQKLISAREQYKVSDEAGYPVYEAEGSLLQVPKRFTIRDIGGTKLATLKRQPISIFPKFNLEIDGQHIITIQKEFSILKPKYRIEGMGVQVKGDIWNMSFDIIKDGNLIAKVDKKWISIRDVYAIEIYEERFEFTALCVVLAIDYVKRLAARARRRRNSSGS